jgi:hypothetical protein
MCASQIFSNSVRGFMQGRVWFPAPVGVQ